MDEETKKYVDFMFVKLIEEFNYTLGPKIRVDMEDVQKRVSDLEQTIKSIEDTVNYHWEVIHSIADEGNFNIPHR